VGPPQITDQNSLDVQINEAVDHHRAGRLFEAEEIYRGILGVDPEHHLALGLLGAIAYAAGQNEQALEFITKAIAAKPDYTDAHNNLGTVLLAMGRCDEALTSLNNAISLSPNNADTHCNKGVALRWLDRPEEALASFRRAVEVQSNFADAHLNLSYLLITLGQNQEGLDHYEWRWRSPTFDFKMREYSCPMWDGSIDLDGKTILVWPEQGPQDVTTWASEIPELATRAEHCIVSIYPKLASLFTRSFPKVEVQLDDGDPSSGSGDFDVHLPLGSLFRALKTKPTSIVPAFLIPDPERVTYWKQRLAELGPGPSVGISWKSPLLTSQREPNYTSIDEWAPVFALPAHFINLQCGDTDEDLAWAKRDPGITVHNFNEIDLFDDLDDVAALSAALDLSITVSTAAAAITAGVGTPTWVITWEQSPWNNFLLAPRGPDVTHFKRNTGESWDAVFAAITKRLHGKL
jgi:tetratricopeptide (TPR) repeat protein